MPGTKAQGFAVTKPPVEVVEPTTEVVEPTTEVVEPTTETKKRRPFGLRVKPKKS